MANNLIRVLLVDDQPLVRQGLHYMINGQMNMQVVGEAANGRDAVTAARELTPDVILMDIEMPECDGIAGTREIMREHPEMKVVILTTFELDKYVYEGIRAGAVGYLLKDAAPEELAEAVHAAYRGEAIFRTAVAARAMQQMIHNQHVVPKEDESDHLAGNSLLLDPLSERELEVLQQMAYGLRNEQIGRELHISESTVKTHVHRILNKLGVSDRTQAVVSAIRGRIVQ